MGAENTAPEAPPELSTHTVEVIDQLDEEELRSIIDYARERREYIHPDITDQIESGPGEEIVRIEERTGYPEVVKKQPCAKGCDECPHGPFLYHVREESRPEGGISLHWDYLGRIRE